MPKQTKEALDFGNAIFNFGVPGGGKTYLQLLLIQRVKAMDEDVNVYIVTPNAAHEYASLVKTYGGRSHVVPHTIGGHESVRNQKDMCRSEISKEPRPVFYHADIGTNATHKEELLGNAWSCLSAISENIREHPDEKFLLAVDDINIFFENNLYPLGLLLLAMVREINAKKDGIILLSGSWVRSLYQSRQVAAIWDEPNVYSQFLPMTSRDAESIKDICRISKKSVDDITLNRKKSGYNVPLHGIKLLLVGPKKDVLGRPKSEIVVLEVSKEEHKVCNNDLFYRKLMVDIAGKA